MTELLIAEQLFLLTHHESGTASTVLAWEQGLSAALLLDLAARGSIIVDAEEVRAERPPQQPLLRRAYDVIAESDEPRTVTKWVDALPEALDSADQAVGESLAERGILTEQRGKLWKIIPRTTWPEVDPEPERGLRADLRAVLVDGAEPDAQLALLVSLLVPLDLVGGLFEKPERALAGQRAEQLAESDAVRSAVPEAVKGSVEAVQLAVMTATIVPVVAATSVN